MTALAPLGMSDALRFSMRRKILTEYAMLSRPRTDSGGPGPLDPICLEHTHGKIDQEGQCMMDWKEIILIATFVCSLIAITNPYILRRLVKRDGEKAFANLWSLEIAAPHSHNDFLVSLLYGGEFDGYLIREAEIITPQHALIARSEDIEPDGFGNYLPKPVTEFARKFEDGRAVICGWQRTDRLGIIPGRYEFFARPSDAKSRKEFSRIIIRLRLESISASRAEKILKVSSQPIEWSTMITLKTK
jgi:hypothetical protein